MPSTMNTIRNEKNFSRSLITRAGQIMGVIIGLGLVSMISSMLVAESLSGDAQKINRAGELRMLAVKVSREILKDRFKKGQGKAGIVQTELLASNQLISINKARAKFEIALENVFKGGLSDPLSNTEINQSHQLVLQQWQQLKSLELSVTMEQFDQFVSQIDHLVLLLQRQSEKKISILRAIHSVSLLLVVLVAFVVLTRINRSIILPLRELIDVAAAAGKGNFEARSHYHEDNELGLLSNTINQMSKELHLMHLNFELRVKEKTSALSNSNRSLELLYNTSKILVNENYHQQETTLLVDLAKVLGFGDVTLETSLTQEASLTHKGSLAIDVATLEKTHDNICYQKLLVPLRKKQKNYGSLCWSYPVDQQAAAWQKNLIESVAEMMAIARSLEQKRVAENRLIIIEERAVIARELHDSLAQSLSYLKFQVTLLVKKMDRKLPENEIDETIGDIKQGLNRAYLQLRELLTTFRLKLEDPSLQGALKGTVVEFSSKCEHPVNLNYDLAGNILTASQEIHILQIVREALSNVHRHARASLAEISVYIKDQTCYVEIVDDGVGMSDNHASEGHFGMGIMKERSLTLNAKLNIGKSEKQGTKISLSFAI